MKNRIITISREFGSGGRTIGRQAAQKLGLPCYDQEFIAKIADETGYSEEFIRERGENAPSGNWLSNAFTDRDWSGLSTQDRMWEAQSRIIRQLAEKEPCVIVGRCADYLLRGSADCLTVFIHASLEKRADRVVRVYGEREGSPEKRVRDKDKRRTAYYEFYTSRKMGDVKNYHLALDSGVLGIDACTEIIARLY